MSAQAVAATQKINMTEDVSYNPRLVVKINYTNWENKTGDREIIPKKIYFGNNQWHKEPQWLLDALDVEKGQVRFFALKDIHSWKPKTPPQGDTPTAEIIEFASEEKEKIVTIDYTDWLGNSAYYEIIPVSISFGSTPWHREAEWQLTALELFENEMCQFALKDIASWKPGESEF